MKFRNTFIALVFVFACFACTSDTNAQVYSSGYYSPGVVQSYQVSPSFNSVQYASPQVIRYGTPLYGVRAVPGQVVRFGTPRAGVRVTGNGVRIGTPRWGVQWGNGQGVQVGRINRWIGR
jgi:hypothetical protein